MNQTQFIARWRQLLSARRWGKPAITEGNAHDRTEFQRDYDRLIFSAPFRRLQNKTQVFPLPGSIFVHNRLTHSLEVASVGRSLGHIFYNNVKELYPDVDKSLPLLAECGNAVAAACLAHDLGNPAFGHSGEAAISRYFTGQGVAYKDLVTVEQWADLTHFEGNANALRLLTHNFKGRGGGGFELTYTTLAAIIKYPCAAIDGHKKGDIHRKKYGYFNAEAETFKAITHELGLPVSKAEPLACKRHPLTWLVEAADDICYSVVDLEDAWRLKILSFEEVTALLKPLAPSRNKHSYLDNPDLDESTRMGITRSKVINNLISHCSQAFMKNQEAIVAGTFNTSLTDALPTKVKQQLGKISALSVSKIYNNHSVVEIEIAGYKLMEGLLEEFVPAMLAEDKTAYHKKLLELIPTQFNAGNGAGTYKKILSVVDFISGMTDIYAVELYRKIKGISFPGMS